MGATAAQAANWQRAESPHFIVYGEMSESRVRDYALMLEDFDSLLRALLIGASREAPASAKLEVYLANSPNQLKTAWPGLAPDIGGFYSSSIDELYAVALRNTAGEDDRNKGDDIVLHEYVHHFIAQYFPSAYPAWLGEGYAEYFATADLSKKIIVGDWAYGRGFRLVNDQWMPVAELISRKPMEVSPQRRGTYYAESWLLTHYLISNPERAKALANYLRALRPGVDAKAAWTQFMGPTEALDTALHAYMKQRLPARVLQRGWTAPEVKVTQVATGEGAVLLLRRSLNERLSKTQAEQAVTGLRELVGKFPDDPKVKLTLALAESRFGDRAAGDKLLDALIAQNPGDADPIRQRAINLLTPRAEDAQPSDADFREASRLLALANKARPDDYRTLYWYARSRQFEPGYPSQNTYNTLLHAADLAPQVDDIRLVAGQMAIHGKDLATAREMLAPVASNPHGGPSADIAEKLLAAMDAEAAADAGQ